MKIQVLHQYLNQLLQPDKFSDYCPNGLQIEGKPNVFKIVTGVTASYALLEAAHAVQADAILVHHGYFWRDEAPAIVGIKKRRIQFLLANQINLFAYHLPLDAHETLGNNVMLAQKIGLRVSRFAGSKNMLAIVELNQPILLETLVQNVNNQLNRVVLTIGEPKQLIQTIAICTGGAQSYIEQAYAAGADVYLSGEISEQTVHIARESSKSYISAGHHATERYGIQALGEHLAQKFGLVHQFIDCDNPA